MAAGDGVRVFNDLTDRVPLIAERCRRSGSREEISHAEAEIDAGKHSKNPDSKKKW